jgi:hypothetical protein
VLPTLVEVGPNHEVACLRVEELLDQSTSTE